MDGAVGTVDALLQALEAQAEVGRRIAPAQLGLSSRCEGWSIRDVMNHSVGVTLKFAQFASGVTDRPSAPKSDLVGPDHVKALAECLESARDSWLAADMTRTCELPFGRFPAHLAAGINLFDVLAHTWDMADPIHLQVDIDAAIWSVGLEAARAVIGPHRDLAHYGEEISVGTNDRPKEQLLGFLGRR